MEVKNDSILFLEFIKFIQVSDKLKHGRIYNDCFKTQ